MPDARGPGPARGRAGPRPAVFPAVAPRVLPGILPAVALALLLALPGAAARELAFTAHGGDGEAWFTVEGHRGRNPTVTLRPGETVNVTLRNAGFEAHNLAIGLPVDLAQACCLGPGMRATFSFTVPADASGRMEYLCQVHGLRGMEGWFELPGEPDAPKEERRGIPTVPPGMPASALVVLALALRRRQRGAEEPGSAAVGPSPPSQA